EGVDVAHQLLLAHGPEWYAHLVHAGFKPSELEPERGFAPAIVISATEPLARSPDAWRLSPVQYQLRKLVAPGFRTDVWECVRATPLGSEGAAAIKPASDEFGAEVIDRELKILRRFTHPHLPRLREPAIARGGRAVVTDWAGTSLATLLAAARAQKAAP